MRYGTKQHLSFPTKVVRHAIVQDTEGKPELAEIPIPTLTPGTLLVKVFAVALDPSDYKMGAAFPTPSAVIGSKSGGTVIAVASVTDTDLRPGDVVAGGSHGSNSGNPENGAFSINVCARAPLTIRFTPTAKLVSEQTATLATALALLPSSLEQPSKKPMPVLVYGGSTATGTIAIQLLRLFGPGLNHDVLVAQLCAGALARREGRVRLLGPRCNGGHQEAHGRPAEARPGLDLGRAGRGGVFLGHGVRGWAVCQFRTRARRDVGEETCGSRKARYGVRDPRRGSQVAE